MLIVEMSDQEVDGEAEFEEKYDDGDSDDSYEPFTLPSNSSNHSHRWSRDSEVNLEVKEDYPDDDGEDMVDLNELRQSFNSILLQEADMTEQKEHPRHSVHIRFLLDD